MAGEWWREIPQEALDILRSQGYELSDVQNFPSSHEPRGEQILINEAGAGIQSVPSRSLSDGDRVVYGEYYTAVRDYIYGRDPDGQGLSEFTGKRVAGRALETNPAVIEQQANAGDPFFDDLYEE